MFMQFYDDAGQMIKLGKAHLALMSCRNALESLVKNYCRRAGIDADTRDSNLEDSINRLYESGATDRRMNELLHRTRMLCNKGAHADESVTMDDAQEAYSYLNEIIGITSSAKDDGRLDEIRKMNNVPVKNPDYYSSSRRYYGKWAHCFDKNSLMVIPEYVELLERAEYGDGEAMLSIAAGFLPKDILWNSNMLINTPSVFFRGEEYNQECSYDARYYFWILKAVREAALDNWRGEDTFPKKYLATALWEAVLFTFYYHTQSEVCFRTAAVDMCGGMQYPEAVYANQYDEVVEMFDHSGEVVDDLFRWDCVCDYITSLVRNTFGGNTDGSVIAPIHKDGRTNTYLKLRFLRYAIRAQNAAMGDTSIRLSETDAAEINSDYDMLRKAAPDIAVGIGYVSKGDAFSWDMLRPYTAGAFCDRIFRFAVSQAEVKKIDERRSGRFMF